MDIRSIRYAALTALPLVAGLVIALAVNFAGRL